MKNKGILLFLLFLVVGSLFLVLGFVTTKKSTYSKSVVGVISAIESEYDVADGHYDHIVYVDYEVDGTKYQHIKANQYLATYDEGDEITIYYNPSNPGEMIVTKPGFAPIGYFGIVLLVFCVIDVVGMIAGKSKAKKIEEQNRINNERIDQENLFK